MVDSKDILKKYVCEMPFMYTDVQWSAQYICCPSWNSKSIRVDEHGNEEDWHTNFNGTADVMRNWTSDLAYDVRKSMLDGSYKYCDHIVCPRLNQLINKKEKPYLFREIEDFKEVYNINSEEDLKNFKTPPEEILFGFDRSCNLKCPSCRVNLIPNDNLESETHKSKLHLLKSIEDNFSSNIKRMMITGSGDPFYSKIYRDYLINFDKSKYPNLEQIQIITNGNLLNEKLWKQMKATPYIKTIEVSIDAATKDTYETKTRLNGQWDVLIKNLKFLATQDTIIEQFVCSMVVSKNNYKEVSMFYELITDIFKDSKFKWEISINYRQIVDWGTYSSEELNGLQIFQKEHPLYEDFIQEIKKIDNLKYVNHNFHHLLKNTI
jgi:MoaA/NifB/PqqE/SkfB family radical SAM enzyme